MKRRLRKKWLARWRRLETLTAVRGPTWFNCRKRKYDWLWRRVSLRRRDAGMTAASRLIRQARRLHDSDLLRVLELLTAALTHVAAAAEDSNLWGRR